MSSRQVAVVCAVSLAAALGACTDVRDFRGPWHGPRVGETAELKVGVAADATATLAIDDIDKRGLAGRLTVDGVIDDAPLASLSAAEADALASMTWDGAPLRVYLAFVPAADGGGDALAVIALFDARIELRVLRGGARPVYAIFALTGGSS
jgi:hypothetical protein